MNDLCDRIKALAALLEDNDCRDEACMLHALADGATAWEAFECLSGAPKGEVVH